MQCLDLMLTSLCQSMLELLNLKFVPTVNPLGFQATTLKFTNSENSRKVYSLLSSSFVPKNNSTWSTIQERMLQSFPVWTFSYFHISPCLYLTPKHVNMATALKYLHRFTTGTTTHDLGVFRRSLEQTDLRILFPPFCLTNELQLL